MAFAKVASEIKYKGHRIETVESPIQIVYVVDGVRNNAFWSIADAKRALKGQPTKFYPVDVESWFD